MTQTAFEDETLVVSLIPPQSEIAHHILTYIALCCLVDCGYTVDNLSSDGEFCVAKALRLLENRPESIFVTGLSVVGGDANSLLNGKMFSIEDFYIGYYK